MQRVSRVVFALCLALVPVAAAVAAEAPPLIAREVLFGNPERVSPRLSPDGKLLGYLAPADGVLNVWVAPVGALAQAKAVTHSTQRPVRNFGFAYTNQHVVYVQDKGGDENWKVYVVDLASGAEKDVTPGGAAAGGTPVQARLQGVSHKLPDEILVAVNNRVPQLHDIHRVNLRTGEAKLVEQNDGGYVGYNTDDDYRVRVATRFTPDGGNELFRKDESGWTSFTKVPAEDSLTTAAVDFDKSGKLLYMVDSRGRDTAALTAVDLASGEGEVVFASDKADVQNAMVHPVEKRIEAAAVNYLREEWQVLDPAVKADLEYLRTVADGDLSVSDRTLDDRTWVVTYVLDDGPVKYYLYDRDAKQAKYLFSNRPALEGVKLAKLRPVEIPSRDGMTLVSYYSLPVESDADGDGQPAAPLATVLLVHGGPWGRDTWGFNSTHQWLANRGYAVLSVNFRGSTGFGKKFLNAGNLEWAAKMHDDLIDAVNWAVAQKIADPKKVAIMGGSYGGYATLVGLTYTPEVFAAGVDIVGPSNLVTLINSVPPYWAPIIEVFKKRMGDHTTEEGRKLLEARSPLHKVDAIRRPLLIGQGANDPRVKQAESDQIVQAMSAKKIPVTYVLFPDEGHGFARPENRKAFNAVTEAFLAQNLGGRYEPIGKDFMGSSIQVNTGAEGVPGVAEALPKPEPAAVVN